MDNSSLIARNAYTHPWRRMPARSATLREIRSFQILFYVHFSMVVSRIGDQQLDVEDA